jgi:hypothetical protein
MSISSSQKKGLLTKGHNLYPWEFQQTVGRSDQQLQYIVYGEFQHLSNFNFRVYEEW